jgi:septum formation protein
MKERDKPVPAAPSQGGPGPVLILASASPRRKALLAQAWIVPGRIVAPDVDETPKKGELPRAYALRMAAAKADAVASETFDPTREGGSKSSSSNSEKKISGRSDVLVLAADTVVAIGRRIQPKADTDEEVARCLRLISGRRHQVMTALAHAVPGKKLHSRIVTTRVAFKVLSEREIADYVASGEGLGKAGGYAIQGRAEAFVRFINGSYSNVVGLPLCETVALLEGCGYRTR